MNIGPKPDFKELAEKSPVFVIKEIIRSYSGEKGAAIPILQAIQNTFGYISPEWIRRVAEYTGIPAGELYSIVTFYAQFRLGPIGEHLIHMCHGTACHLAGAEKITESLQFETGAAEGRTSEDGLFTLEKVACLGCCSLAPVITIGDETHGRLTPDKIRKIIKDIRKRSTGNKGGPESEEANKDE